MSDTRSGESGGGRATLTDHLSAPSAGLLVLPDAAFGGYLADHRKVHLATELAAARTEDDPAAGQQATPSPPATTWPSTET